MNIMLKAGDTIIVQADPLVPYCGPDASEAYDLIDLMNQANHLLDKNLTPSDLGFHVDCEYGELYHASNALVGHLINDWPRVEPTLDEVRDGKAPIEGTPVPGIRKRVTQALTDLGVQVDDAGLSHLMHAIYNRHGESQQPNRRDTIMSHAVAGDTFRVLTARGWLGDVGLKSHGISATLDEMVAAGDLFRTRNGRYGFPPPKTDEDVAVYGSETYTGENWRTAVPSGDPIFNDHIRHPTIPKGRGRTVGAMTKVKGRTVRWTIMEHFEANKNFSTEEAEEWLAEHGYNKTSATPALSDLRQMGYLRKLKPMGWYRFLVPCPSQDELAGMVAALKDERAERHA